MFSWVDSFDIVLLFVFLAEILLARRIYIKSRKRNQQVPQHILFVLAAPKPQACILQSAANEEHPSVQPVLHKCDLPSIPPIAQEATKSRVAMATCIVGVFLIAFILINWMLRPFTYAWTLRTLPVFLPLPFLALPPLFQLKAKSTFGLILGGLGLGLVLLLAF